MEVLRYGYRIPFLCDPPLSRAPISMPSYHPSSTKGVALREVTQALVAKSAVELAPLPSLGFYSRLFVVWKTSGSWRPVIDLSTLNLYVDVAHFRMETIQSVLLSVRQGDWMASIDLKEAYLQVPVHPDSSLPSVCGSGQSLPVLCPLLWALHSSSGLLSGHGSCFRHSPLLGYLHEAVPRRLVGPVLVSSLSPPRSPGGSRSLPGAGDCGQPLQVSPGSISGSPIPRCSDRFPVFPGFSVFGACRQASLNRRRISLLRRSSCQFLANASRHSVISRPSCSRWPSEGEVSSAVSTQAVGSGGYVYQDSLVSGLPQGSSVVARPSSSVSRGVSCSDLPRSGL